MGDKQNQPFRLPFNASLKVDLQGSWATSEGGLIVVRELDERLGFGDLIVQHPTDSCRLTPGQEYTAFTGRPVAPVRLQPDSGL